MLRREGVAWSRNIVQQAQRQHEKQDLFKDCPIQVVCGCSEGYEVGESCGGKKASSLASGSHIRGYPNKIRLTEVTPAGISREATADSMLCHGWSPVTMRVWTEPRRLATQSVLISCDLTNWYLTLQRQLHKKEGKYQYPGLETFIQSSTSSFFGKTRAQVKKYGQVGLTRP